nr:uncharacterized protein LOC123497499 [Aegilops tauschii subsp. strangulata]
MSRSVEAALREDIRSPVDALIKKTKTKFAVDVSRSVAYRARRKAVDVVQGDHKQQYLRLRDYLQAVLDTNPGSRCIVTTFEDPENPTPTPRFKYMFYCLAASKEGFLNGCRPFIGLDGCFIKLTTGQQILAATGRDGNNNIYPIAFGVVDKEDGESWNWFLTQLRCCIGSGNKFGTYTIMSDRQKGLLKAINEVFPDSPQRYCLRHIYANFQSAGFRGQELKKYLVVNNLSEVFNKMILDVRAKPIRTMFEGIRTKQMIKRQQTREKLQISRWTITPTYSEILEENKQYAKYCQADRDGPTIWQVTSKEKQYCVDMEGYTCDCKRWNMTGVPCSQGISVLTKQKLHPEDYVNDFFKKPLYLETYKEIIYPIPGPDFWPHTNTPDIEPPVFKEKAGRKQTARRKGEFEVPAPRDTSRMGTITCGNCGLEGHKKTGQSMHLLQYKLQEHQPLVQEHQLLLHQHQHHMQEHQLLLHLHQLLLQQLKGVGLQVEGEARDSVHQDLLLQLQMFWLLGEVVDEQDEVARAERRANHRAQAQERRQRIAAMIMAEQNQNDVKQFKEVFPEGTNITDELIIW